jgi:hypothetical protein
VDELYQLQVEKWEPIVRWFCEHYDVDIASTQSIEMPTIPIETKAALTRHLLSHNFNSIYGNNAILCVSILHLYINCVICRSCICSGWIEIYYSNSCHSCKNN